jgi:opacity protein-like surface antigen
MKRTIAGVVAVGLLSVAGSALSAQNIRIGVGGGVVMPMSDYKDIDKAGWLAGVDATYWLAATPIGIRIEGDYSQTSHKNNVPGHTSFIGGMAELVYALGSSASPMRPYVLGGLGYFHAKIDVTGLGSATENKLGWGIGAGVAFKVGTGGARLFAEGRYQSVQTSGTSLKMIPIRAGIRFGS